jgi:hypothetical protein
MPSMTIIYNSGTPRFNTPPGVTYLSPGDSLTLQLAGFPVGSAITGVSIYNNQVMNGNDQKGTFLCSWASNGSNSCTVYGIGAQSATQVTITDDENPVAADKYWFGVTGTIAGGSPWSLDPELINRPGT